MGQQAGEDIAWDGDLVIGDRQASLGDVEDAGGGAPVVAGVVQDASEHPVALDVVGGEAGGVLRQGQGPRQARLVQDEGGAGQPRGDGRALQVGVEEGLNALVGGTGAVSQPTGELALASQNRGHETVRLTLLDRCRNGESQQLQTQGDGGSGGRVCSCHGTSLDKRDDTLLLRSAQTNGFDGVFDVTPAGRPHRPTGTTSSSQDSSIWDSAVPTTQEVSTPMSPGTRNEWLMTYLPIRVVPVGSKPIAARSEG